ncbi:hypothetical protein FCH28_25585 [Streptomyces piniterrae]|uniref:Uncharacterized protein n=1 Tax=Streptomyces piniterrae TaxID=2571125 RepID=A0A4U0N768_9ACTN|nr:hypothetical protein [Streptomyces piniterrae]TJZ49651.1 hypothetical protein FCH28_25585 [Streptomyces piniterrae]
MNRRHIRAVAVFGLVVVTLTGARGSHGGGCGSSHSSSSSSSGGYSSSSSGGYSSSGSTTGGTPTSSSTTAPESDIRITDCKVDSAAGTLSATLSVTNGNSGSNATYNGTVEFTDETGATFGSAMISSVKVPAGQTQSANVSGTFIKNPNGQGPSSGKCKLGPVYKVNDLSTG